MDYDYTLIEVTEQGGHFTADYSLFVEAHWGKEAPPLDGDALTAVGDILNVPFDKAQEDVIRREVGAALVLFYSPPTAEAGPPEEPEAPAEEAPALGAPSPVEGLPADRVAAITAERFAIHSTVRARHNRALRARAPQHHRFTQYVTTKQRRLTRNRPVGVSGAELLSHLGELRQKAKQGILEVRTLHGQRLVNLDTLEIAASALGPPPVRRPLDTAATDTNGGEFIPPFAGALPVTPPPPDAETAVPLTIERAAVAGVVAAPAGEIPAALPAPGKKKKVVGR